MKFFISVKKPKNVVIKIIKIKIEREGERERRIER